LLQICIITKEKHLSTISAHFETRKHSKGKDLEGFFSNGIKYPNKCFEWDLLSQYNVINENIIGSLLDDTEENVRGTLHIKEGSKFHKNGHKT